jgi:hypothetical protein
MSTEPTSPKAAGGKARAASLPAARRRAIAKRAAEARWAETTKEAVCGSPDKPLVIGDMEIECYVLDDGTRVLTQTALLQALGRSPKLMGRRTADDHGDLPPVLRGKTLQPFLSSDIAEKSKVIAFRTPTGGRSNGYTAELLPEICEIYLAAREAGALQPQQQHIARAAEVLVRGLARIGIIALVDEATGYQEIRTKNALEKILEDYIDKELQPYLKTFPDDFYKEMFRLKGKPYSADGLRPQYFGIHTNDVIYKRLAPGVLEELKRVQEKGTTGRGKHKLFQKLTQNVGYPKLREHLGSVVMLMKLSSDWDDFKEKLDQYHPLAEGSQVVLPMERPAKTSARRRSA